jgi:hypothetical protein
MGSWTELDAYYPPGRLTPAAAFVVALGHLAGASSVYANGIDGALAAFFPRHGLAADRDLLERAEHFLNNIALRDFVAEAHERLNPQQLRCLLVNLLDALLASGNDAGTRSRFGLLSEGLGATPEQLAPYRHALEIKNDLSVFPQ